MNLLESMQKRHAVRDYNDEPLTAEQVNTLDEAIAAANAKQGLDIQLIHDVDDAFGGCPTHYGRFKNVHNLIALIGTDSPSNEAILDEKVGHAGQLLALTAVSLGLDTSWVVLHETADHDANAPDWFKRGVEASMLAPSALGKQPFRFTLLADGRTVRAEALEGVQPEIGLGIAKLHFELAAGTDSFVWA